MSNPKHELEERLPRSLARLIFEPKTGNERFHAGSQDLGINLCDFWRWSVSDLVSNATRGILAEFIVANALGIPSAGVVRDEWAPWDLLMMPENLKIEVKSAAYIQTWHQSALSKIIFQTHKTVAFDADTNQHAIEAKRQADVYVFALLAHQDKTTIDPLNVEQWEFYGVPTRVLNERKRSQHSITLPSLKDLPCKPVSYGALREDVRSKGLTG